MDQLQPTRLRKLARKSSIVDEFKKMEDLGRDRSRNDTKTQAGECMDFKLIHNPVRISILFITTCNYI